MSKSASALPLVLAVLTATASSAIETEKPDGIAERVFFHYGTDRQMTLASYAVANIGGCTGTMVGPNVLVTAAHCQSPPRNATFRVYVTADFSRTESFACTYLLHTWPEMDLLAYWCQPNAAGVNPGDKYGYVDFELAYALNGAVDFGRSRNLIDVGDEVVAIWRNDIGMTGDHMLYSKGEVTSTDEQMWANPGGDLCDQPDDDPVGIHTDAWARSGASGSMQFVPATGRAILAPLSLAPDTSDGGPSRHASSAADMFEHGTLVDMEVKNPLIFDNPDTDERCLNKSNPHVNLSTLEDLWDAGIRFDLRWSSADKYIGSLDKNVNGVLDMQEDLERSAGEGARDLYYFGFHSPRLNAQSVTGEEAQVSWFGHLGFLDILDTRVANDPDGDALASPRQLVTWPGSDVLPPGSYWVLVNSKSSARDADAMRLCLGTCLRTRFGESNHDTVVHEFASGGRLNLLSFSRHGGLIWEAVVVREGTVHDFDIADKRRLWSIRRGGQARQHPADIRPIGRQSGTRIDWGAVVSDRRAGDTAEFALHSHLLPIPEGRTQICFSARRMPDGAREGRGIFRLDSAEVTEIEFALAGSGWERVCSENTKIAAEGSMLSFGTIAEPGYSYIVDDIEVSTGLFVPPTPPDVGPIVPVDP